MRRAGFTLAELLIALALTAVSLGIVAEGVRHSLAFQARIKSAQIEREAMTTGLAALRGRLERLVPLTIEAGAAEPGILLDQGERILFSGAAELVRFVAADPAYPSTPGLYEYVVAIEPAETQENDGFQVTLSRTALIDLSLFDSGTAPADSWIVMTSADAPRFGYAGADTGWQPVWSSQDSFPTHIRIEFGEGAQPPLVVALARSVAVPEDAAAEDEITQ